MNVTSGSKSYNIPYYLILVFFILAVSIGFMGYIYYENQKANIIREKQNELSAIADLKVGQIKEWREERMADANAIFKNHLISGPLKRFFESTYSVAVRKDIVTWLKILNEHERYKEIFLFNAKGNLRLEIPGNSTKVEPHMHALIEKALKAQKVSFTDLHREEDTGHIHLSFTIPILMTEARSISAIGVLLLEIDPYQFLYPLIQSWPTPSPTAETLLVRREGNEVVFLNELRHKKDTALSLRFPITQKTLPATMAALGKEGIMEGIDYRGVPVIAALRTIPHSPWFIVSKIDKEEVFAPVRKRAWFIAIIVFAAIIGAGLSVGLWWRQQRVIFYRRQYEAELKFSEEREKAAEELRRHAAELKRSNEELQQFAYIASHDLQEPLRMIASYLQLIERRYKGKLDKDADEFIAFAVEGANRLQNMIIGLLAYSRVGTKGKAFEDVNCSEVFANAILNLKLAIEESGALVTSDRLPVVRADYSQLAQVFQNLISNAIKFKGSEPPRIHISAEMKDMEWLFSVKDNGIGISTEYKDRIFNIFQRLHGREYPGVGIGLSICRRIVERHGGRIWFESEVGKGAAFYFTIPKQ